MNLKFKIEHFDAIAFDDCCDERILRYKREFEISHIPPLDRRRLSRAAKCAFDLTRRFNALDMPVVFSSHEGEINRCFELQNTLAKGEPLSPTSFSLSVHNAVSSLLGIGMKNRCEISAISAFAPLEYALIQAHLLLDSGFERVLTLAYCETIKQEYFSEEGASCMVMLVVSKGENLRLSSEEKRDDRRDKNLLIKFLQNFDINKKSSWQSSDKNLVWRWDYEP